MARAFALPGGDDAVRHEARDDLRRRLVGAQVIAEYERIGEGDADKPPAGMETDAANA